MKWQYVTNTLRKSSLKMIEMVNEIIDEYEAMGFVLTVRQVYYQMVARGLIPNNLRSYKTLASIINNGKLAGMIDWDMIEDRTRAFRSKHRYANGAEVLEAAAYSFHMDMWGEQEYRVFCIVEKDALFGVLNGVCQRYDVPLLAARGYPSGTVLREFVEHSLKPYPDQKMVILHLGDHDPSGIDMTRDLKERIQLFCEGEVNLHLQRIALNIDQVREQKPPENPAKMTDSRVGNYIRTFGRHSWELDALNPQYLAELVERHVEPYVDEFLWDERKAKIESIRGKISSFSESFKE